MKLHILKIKPTYFYDVVHGFKTFEIRKDDREYEVGDIIHFINSVDSNEYPLLKSNAYQITYILRNVPDYGLKQGYCILGIKKIRGN